jgi:hypothetical protein
MKKKLFSLFKKPKSKSEKSPEGIGKDRELEERIQAIRNNILKTKNELDMTLDGVNKHELQQLFLVENPDDSVYELFQCLLHILAGRAPDDMIEVNSANKPINDNWASCRKMIIHPDFLKELRKLKEINLSEDHLKMIDTFKAKRYELTNSLFILACYMITMGECDRLYNKTINYLMSI